MTMESSRCVFPIAALYHYYKCTEGEKLNWLPEELIFIYSNKNWEMFKYQNPNRISSILLYIECYWHVCFYSSLSMLGEDDYVKCFNLKSRNEMDQYQYRLTSKVSVLELIKKIYYWSIFSNHISVSNLDAYLLFPFSKQRRRTIKYHINILETGREYESWLLRSWC